MPARFVSVLTVFLILALSAQVVMSKRESGQLKGDLAASTLDFVQGREVPDLVVQTTTSPTTLRAFCGEGQPVVYFVATRSCPFCAQLEPRWARLASEQRDHLFVKVHLDGLPHPPATDTSNVIHVSADPTELHRHLHIGTVPAIMTSGANCRIRAAGTGMTRAGMVLAGFARSP
jgi:thiol-disulfide isomerase/thioredoxin